MCQDRMKVPSLECLRTFSMFLMFEKHPVWVAHLQPVGHDDNAGVLKCTEEFFSCPFLFLPVILLLELMDKEKRNK